MYEEMKRCSSVSIIEQQASRYHWTRKTKFNRVSTLIQIEKKIRMGHIVHVEMYYNVARFVKCKISVSTTFGCAAMVWSKNILWSRQLFGVRTRHLPNYFFTLSSRVTSSSSSSSSSSVRTEKEVHPQPIRSNRKGNKIYIIWQFHEWQWTN